MPPHMLQVIFSNYEGSVYEINITEVKVLHPSKTDILLWTQILNDPLKNLFFVTVSMYICEVTPS